MVQPTVTRVTWRTQTPGTLERSQGQAGLVGLVGIFIASSIECFLYAHQEIDSVPADMSGHTGENIDSSGQWTQWVNIDTTDSGHRGKYKQAWTMEKMGKYR